MNDETHAEMSSEEPAYPEIEYVVKEVPKRSSLFRRLGCGMLLVVWFGFLLLPLLLFILAVNGQITINHSDNVPDRYQHPRFQIYVQMEPGTRGLQFTRTSIRQQNNEHLCLEVSVSYLLWEGQGDSAKYCDCYKRDTTDADWVFAATSSGDCS